MEGKRPDIESKLEEFSTRLSEAEDRLAELENRLAIQSPAVTTPVEEMETASRHPSTRPVELIPLAGRTLLVMSGAFLLRAVTESGILHEGAGTALGIVYAVALVLLANREAARGKRRSATFHGLAAAFIVFPLLWEATIKFRFLSPAQGVAGLAAITALTLFLGWRSNSKLPVWVFTSASAATAIALLLATKLLILYVSFLVALGLATLWLGYTRRWWGLAWSMAALVDGFLFLLPVMFMAGRTDEVLRILDPLSLVILQLSAVIIYIGSFIGRSLVRRSLIGTGELVQGSIIVLFGIGGMIAVSEVTGSSGVLVGVVSLILAVCCYGASFAFIDRHDGVRVNFIFFTTLALVLTGAALCKLLEGSTLAFAFALATLVAGWLGAVRLRATLGLHAAVYSLAGAVTSGLFSGALASLTGPAVPAAAWITIPVLVTLGTAACCSWFHVPDQGRSWGAFSRGSKYPFLVVLLFGTCGIITTLAAPLLADTGSIEPDRSVLAVLRTGILAAAAIGLALVGRAGRFREASWLVYPVLAVGLIKLVIEDVRAGRPVTLMVSLFLFGLALILAPRLARKARSGSE